MEGTLGRAGHSEGYLHVVGRMARGRLINEQGQKASIIEIVDLTSEDDSDPPDLSSLHRGADEDVPIFGFEDQEQSGEDQWESESLYEDALEELEDTDLLVEGEQFAQSKRACAHLAHSTVTCPSWRVLHSRGGLGLPKASSPRW